MNECVDLQLYTVPMVIDFPQYNMKCFGGNEIPRGIFHVVSGFPPHFMLYRGNLDYFFDSIYIYSKEKSASFHLRLN